MQLTGPKILTETYGTKKLGTIFPLARRVCNADLANRRPSI